MKLSFSKETEADLEKLVDISLDYEIMPKLFPIEIIDKKIIDNEVVLTEKISFYKFNFLQKSSHVKKDNCLITKILSGPLSNSVIESYYEKINNGTKIIIEADLKLKLRYRPLGSFIKKRYEKALSRILNETISLAILTKNKKWSDCLVQNKSGLIITWKNSNPFTMFNWDPWTLAEIFYDEDYSRLPVSGRTVVDIGGFNADSAIYFSLKGASKVIAIEPFPKNYEIAYKNIHENNFENNIILLNAACTKDNGTIKLDSEYFGSDNKAHVDSNTEIEISNVLREIPSLNLAKIVSTYEITDASLKIDCEGCEYDIILLSPEHVLKKFFYIILEFHNGAEKLVKKLIDSDFSVDVEIFPNYKNNSRGIIFGQRKNLLDI